VSVSCHTYCLGDFQIPSIKNQASKLTSIDIVHNAIICASYFSNEGTGTQQNWRSAPRRRATGSGGGWASTAGIIRTSPPSWKTRLCKSAAAMARSVGSSAAACASSNTLSGQSPVVPLRRCGVVERGAVVGAQGYRRDARGPLVRPGQGPLGLDAPGGLRPRAGAGDLSGAQQQALVDLIERTAQPAPTPRPASGSPESSQPLAHPSFPTRQTWEDNRFNGRHTGVHTKLSDPRQAGIRPASAGRPWKR
jgi:hypothetical protein